MGSDSGDNDLGSDLLTTSLINGSEALGIAAGSNLTAATATGTGTEILYTAGDVGFLASMTALSERDAFGDLQRAGVEILPHANKHVYAEDGGEYGIRLGTYLDDVGTGVDLNFICKLSQ